MSAPRDWSVHPVWILGESSPSYAKVRPLAGGLVVGAPVQIQRERETRWRLASIAEPPDDRAGLGGGTLWIELVTPARP